jgi:arylsulfatase A-like enzyme
MHHRVRANADPALNPAQVTLAQVLRSCGWRTGAFVGSAMLAADRGLAGGFDVYDDGRVAGTPPPAGRPGNEVIDRALEWLTTVGDAPFFLWVNLSAAPSEAQLARLMRALDERSVSDDAVIIVAGDQTELSTEHRVPVAIRAPRVTAQRVDGVVSLIDLAATALDLLHLPSSLGDGRSLAPAMRDQQSTAFTRR